MKFEIESHETSLEQSKMQQQYDASKNAELIQLLLLLLLSCSTRWEWMGRWRLWGGGNSGPYSQWGML